MLKSKKNAKTNLQHSTAAEDAFKDFIFGRNTTFPPQNESKKINFTPIGRRQYEDDLFDLEQHPVDFEKVFHSDDASKGYAEKHEQISFYWEQALDYLKNKGLEDTSGYFYVNNGQIERWSEGIAAPYYSLATAIELRDGKQGITSDYIAALIDHNCKLFYTAWNDIQLNGRTEIWGFILDTALHIQFLYVKLFSREHILLKYKVGERVLNSENSFPEYIVEKADSIFKELKSQVTKEERRLQWCYRETVKQLKEAFPNEATPEFEWIRKRFMPSTFPFKKLP